MAIEVHAPYHFVPLSKWVYMPDWAHLVSHDVPFEDGLSGVIDYTLTNHTPLCVGDSKDKHGVLKFARDPLGHLIIPGSSLKGMIRGVLEIASFGKFASTDNRHFAYRDFSDSRYKSWVEANQESQAGWINYDANQRQWTFRKAKHTVLFLDEFRSAIANVSTAKHGSVGAEKYRQFPLSKTFRFDLKPRTFTYNNPEAKSQNVQRAQLGKNGEHVGHAIFSSFRPTIYPMHASKRNTKIKRFQLEKKDQSTCIKRTEFSYAFYDMEDPFTANNLDQQVARLFESHEIDQVNLMKKNAHPDFGIPVFAKLSGQQISSLGFAKMPKIKYTNSTHQLVEQLNPAHLAESYFDMAELMFGTLREKGLGLKSRVYFSDAPCSDKPQLFDSKRMVLNEPKATFYPTYLEQGNTRKLNTYNQDSVLAGTKRYISKTPDHPDLAASSEQNQNISQCFELCAPGTHFEGKIAFHNLKTVELAALMWCLQLKGSHHQLGHGKPFGAGAVTVNAKLSSVRTNNGSAFDTGAVLTEKFEQAMQDCYPSNLADCWISSPQIQYLLAIGDINQNADVDTRYMSLKTKDFQNAKSEHVGLKPLRAISRREKLSLSGSDSSLSFGRGRLAALINKDSEFDTSQLEQQESKLRQLNAQREQQQQLELEQQKRAQMSSHELALHDLITALDQCEADQKPPLLRETVNHFLDQADSSASEPAKQLYDLARQNDFHKKPKKRIKEHKQLLSELSERYGLDL